MARKSSGTDQLVSARELLRTAKTATELRAAQAVLLPLELGMLRYAEFYRVQSFLKYRLEMEDKNGTITPNTI